MILTYLINLRRHAEVESHLFKSIVFDVPIPLVEPVMTATFPSSLPIASLPVADVVEALYGAGNI